MTRLRILNDLAFKKALGEKGDEPQLLAFLNAVLERTGKNNLQSVEIMEGKDIAAETVGGKSARLDVLAKLASGAKVNIEVQNRNELNIEKRSLYYWSRKYAEGLGSGEDYIELVPVIGIKGINTAGQALHPPPAAGSRGKLRGIKPFGSSLARSCPCKHGRDLTPFVNQHHQF